MDRPITYWRAATFVAAVVAAFALGRGGGARAEAAAKSQLVNVSHVGTNEEGDVLWAYVYDGANREWVVYRVDYNLGQVDVKVIPHPRVPGGY